MFPARRNVFAAVLFSLLLLPADVRAQAAASAQAAAAPVAKPNAADLAAAGQTITLDASSNVPQSISVQAALIPHDIAKRLFSTEVADRYALVQITLSNHNPRAAFVLEVAVLDDCHWLLSGRVQTGGSSAARAARCARNRWGEALGVKDVKVRSARATVGAGVLRRVCVGAVVAGRAACGAAEHKRVSPLRFAPVETTSRG